MKLTKSIIFALKLLFATILLAYIVNKLLKEDILAELKAIEFTRTQFTYFVLFLLLMPINWLIEAVKWQYLMSTLKKISLREALQSVLAGVSTGILTPNRLGNFIGRTYGLQKDIKTRSILLTLLSNLAQFIITIVFGLIGLMAYLMMANDIETNYIVTFVVLSLLFGLWLYFKPVILLKTFLKRLLTNALISGVEFINDSRIRIKTVTLFYSALRYVVFLTQYVFLLRAFGQSHDLFILYIGVSLVYLIMTILPSLTFGKLFVREASALFVLAKIGVPNTVIILTGFVLWLINVAIPSLIGGTLLIVKK